MLQYTQITSKSCTPVLPKVSDYLQAHEYFEQPHVEHTNCCIGCLQSPTCRSGRFSVCSLYVRSGTRVESITSCNSKSANIRTSRGSLYCHSSHKNKLEPSYTTVLLKNGQEHKKSGIFIYSGRKMQKRR